MHFTVKSLVTDCTGLSTHVYTCLLEASKDFDRVNYLTLFAKLIDAHASLLIVRVLLFWYQMQQVCIKRGKSCSNYFTICNGVRQCGILSPKLVTLYMNQLTNNLIACNAGCYFNSMCINHVMYVFIGQEALKFVSESKYLGFSFSDSKCDDCDMLCQMRSLYAKSNRLLRTFIHCSIDVKVTLFHSYCIALYCPCLWTDYKKSTVTMICVAFNNAYRKNCIFPRGAVQEQCMQITISTASRLC